MLWDAMKNRTAVCISILIHSHQRCFVYWVEHLVVCLKLFSLPSFFLPSFHPFFLSFFFPSLRFPSLQGKTNIIKSVMSTALRCSLVKNTSSHVMILIWERSIYLGELYCLYSWQAIIPSSILVSLLLQSIFDLISYHKRSEWSISVYSQIYISIEITFQLHSLEILDPAHDLGCSSVDPVHDVVSVFVYEARTDPNIWLILVNSCNLFLFTWWVISAALSLTWK